VGGLDVARERRPASSDRDLARGPARLCRVLGIDLTHNGTRPELVAGETVSDLSTGPRVGLRHAAERPWRFWITGDPTVSTYRPAATRRRTGR
jgi:DNA-3-methyladenine glycosylase